MARSPAVAALALVLLASAVCGCSAEATSGPDALNAAEQGPVGNPHEWQFEGTKMTPPAGWALVKEHHEPVPTDGGPPVTSHTVGYAADPDQPSSPMIELSVFAGEGAPTTLAEVRKSEAAPREWDTARPQPVILAREEGLGSGLTIASWDESPTLHVSVIGRNGVTLDMVRDAVESVVIASG